MPIDLNEMKRMVSHSRRPKNSIGIKLILILYWFILGILTVPLILIVLSGLLIGGVVTLIAVRIDSLEKSLFESNIIIKE